MMTRVLGARSLARDLGSWQEESGRRPAYRALADGIRLLVHDGRVPLGVALPSERELAAVLELSRTTITSSYSVLRDEGYLISRQGSRSTVALPAGARPNGLMFRSHQPGPSGPVVDLSYAAMAAPAAQVELAYASALQELPNFLPTHGMEPVGIADLRDVIAQRYTARGLPTTAEQIMVTSGAQHALRLLLSVLTSPGERVLVDHPTYPNALEAIRRNGARPVPVPVRPELAGAWDLDGIRSAARQTAARMAYLIPDFHNPTGLCMDSSGRAELAKIAHETRMTLVVDETMVDLWLDAPPPAPVASHGRGAAKTEVVTLGSTAKSLWGGLRVGWIRADAALITQLVGARAAVDLGTPVMDQLAAAYLLADDRSLLEQRREVLREQRAVLLGAVAEHLPDWRPTIGSGGMSVWMRMSAPVSTALAAVAPNFGVLLAAGPRFGVEGAFERFIRVPYARSPEDLIRGVASIAAAYDTLATDRDTADQRMVVV
ncbi:PLP-dependent aminotransferase family protein [Rhodococcus qingshengii]|uniref:MocR-like transcription factor YczR n=1 Tax=Rhodococcus TaxID=1827 RepID=UPI000E49359B|nr:MULTISPECIES: PLP-dependent aminotransferase family protein [Rhodococcus]RGP50790.1 DNA-binding transcriptional regulator [Rhodococcus erythropolis]THJ68276.1 PLP-dependent aminotransferase family protein [Rhodococcus qingshengii]UEL34511.1 PLP-dependent aminotransferase family protein [Rhodococcus sp. C1]